MADASSLCSNPECQVAQLGHCHLGHDPVESCPNYGEDEIEGLDPGDIELEAISPLDEIVDGVELRSNTRIEEDVVTRFRNRVRVSTIVLVGEQKAGKTTLLAALYGLFCKGPVGSHEFVSSQTLYAFAERNHLALYDPVREVPGTPRTSLGEGVSYFHLKIRSGDDVSEIMISDRSGEAFEHARVDTALIDRLTELPLADRICFLLDAHRLTKINTRSGYRRTFKQTIRTLLDNDAVPRSAILEVLVTKLDRVSHDPELLQQVTDFEDELREEFGERSNELVVHRICALPRAKVDVGFLGMEELVSRWASVAGPVDIRPAAQVGVPLRQIDRVGKLWNE
ncbi:TRAFAC clade GTPase domain-containing protein [Rhizobium leguminosarum]|uniref:TRAFAC clade GTPase domain-containing protein n=1 Tax=Rhizobium leguminosarum TaxID=384 RepID=UPI00143F6A62|nr:hypothetical protein [Rhizobium leguminosarum]NKL23676.1 hypothetical protein [Rhizobium leguminosarum bv. viciae]